MRRALASKLLFAPGTGYEYSNAGYSLLAAIVEIVSGQPYEVYLTDRVLKPAGIRESGYKLPKWEPDRIGHGYQDGQDWGTILQRIQEPYAPYWTLRGNGGLHTTLADSLAWHRALDTDAVLPAAARARFFTPYVAEGPQARSHYAYGWAVSKTPRGTTLVEHNGGNGIYVAEFLRFVDEDTMLFLTSTVPIFRPRRSSRTCNGSSSGETSRCRPWSPTSIPEGRAPRGRLGHGRRGQADGVPRRRRPPRQCGALPFLQFSFEKRNNSE